MTRISNFGALVLGALLLPAAPALADLSEAMAAADLAKGERAFKKCKSCHVAEVDGKKKTGPNLYGVVGAPVAGVADYKYSSALKEYGGTWSLERLDAFLTKPKAEVKGTKMSFAGLKKERDRINLIAYLNAQSDAPLIFGEAEAAMMGEATDDEPPEFGILKVADGVETTFYACTACHSEMIVAQQGLTRDHWEELLEWMVDEQGMSEIDEPDRTEILNYLATHYNEDRPNFPKP